jgi:hypothetical protein
VLSADLILKTSAAKKIKSSKKIIFLMYFNLAWTEVMFYQPFRG